MDKTKKLLMKTYDAVTATECLSGIAKEDAKDDVEAMMELLAVHYIKVWGPLNGRSPKDFIQCVTLTSQ